MCLSIVWAYTVVLSHEGHIWSIYANMVYGEIISKPDSIILHDGFYDGNIQDAG